VLDLEESFLLRVKECLKRYHLRHAYPIRNIKNVRVEKGLLSKTLVMEGYWSDGEKFVLRYDGIKNPENWTEPIKELMKASKLFKQAYEEIIGLINLTKMALCL